MLVELGELVKEHESGNHSHNVFRLEFVKTCDCFCKLCAFACLPTVLSPLLPVDNSPSLVLSNPSSVEQPEACISMVFILWSFNRLHYLHHPEGLPTSSSPTSLQCSIHSLCLVSVYTWSFDFGSIPFVWSVSTLGVSILGSILLVVECLHLVSCLGVTLPFLLLVWSFHLVFSCGVTLLPLLCLGFTVLDRESFGRILSLP